MAKLENTIKITNVQKKKERNKKMMKKKQKVREKEDRFPLKFNIIISC